MDAIIPIDKLGNFPIVQFAVAILIVALGGAMMWRALTKSTAQPAGGEAPDGAAELRSQLRQELLRRDLEKVFGSHRIAIENRLREFENGIHEKIDALSEERRDAVRAIEARVRELEIGRR